jgi:transposase
MADLPGFHVTGVARSSTGMRLHVETDHADVFCPACGVQAVPDGRQTRLLHDIRVFGVPVILVWAKRTFRCRQRACPRLSWSEECELAPARKHFTTRALTWAVDQLLSRDVTISALAHDLQVGWHTLWKAIEGPLQKRLTELNEQTNVEALGIDEHVWRHCGPHKNRMITGIVDHTRPPRDANGKTKPFARLLDVQVGRSGAVAEEWLASQGTDFTTKIRIAAIDPYRGYANAISVTLKEVDMVVDIFHVTKLASQAPGEVRRRVQQDTLGHRGHAKDPLYRARRLLLTGVNHLSEKMATKLDALLQDGDPNWEVTLTWTIYQKLITAYQQPDSHDMVTLIDALRDCPIPEVARLGRTLRSWKREILAYWYTDRSNAGPTEAINNVIETTRRIARGFRNYDNYRLRILASASGQRPYRQPPKPPRKGQPNHAE